jgi:hypothetical protein
MQRVQRRSSFMAETTPQLAVFMKNVPGMLHDILQSITEAGINIEAIMVHDAVDYAVVRMVVDAPVKAIHLLGERGLLVVETDVVSHDMPNRPGQLLELAGKLAKGNVNIAYIYGSTPREEGLSRVFLSTSDDAKVLKILGGGKGRAKKGEARPKSRR